MNEQDFQKLLNEHDELLGLVEGRHKDLLTEKQRKVFQQVRELFIDKLERDEDGNVKMNSSNIALLNTIDEVFELTSSAVNTNIVNHMTTSLKSLVKSNANYFSKVDGNAKVLPILPKVDKAMSGWLGITNGTPQKNGFIDQLLGNDTTSKIAVKNLAMKIVIGQQGLESAKNEMKTLIEGNKDRLGLFERHYKTFANDLYSQIDRATANVIRTDLKFEFAIYVGGLIETSRPFCEEHNGKVFHISEILKFDPKVGIPPNYDPIHDLGGYNCRHHLRWISTAMAKAMGKDVDKFIKKDEVKPQPKPKTETKKPTEEKPKEAPKPKVVQEKIPMKIPFDDVVYNHEQFVPDADFKKEVKKYEENVKKFQTARNELKELKLKYQELSKKYRSKKTTPEQREEIWKEQNKTWNEMNERKQTISSSRNSFRKNKSDEFEKMIQHKTEEVEITYKTNSLDKKQVQNFDEVLGMFKKISSKYLDTKELELVIKNTRAYRSGRTIAISPKEERRVIMHELGHVLEDNNFVMKVAVDFLERRTEGSKTLSFKKEVNSAYRADEFFQEGGFFSEYVGKIYRGINYKGRQATEVISMGLEEMFNNPHQFYLMDKEHFELIYNLFIR